MERVLNLITNLERGGAQAMVMNYYRHIDRSQIQFDFLLNRQEDEAYEEEIESLGGRIFRMAPQYPSQFRTYKKEFRTFLREHPEYRIIHSHLEERSYFPLRIAKEEHVPVRIAHAHNAYRGFDAKTLFRDYFRFRLPPYPTHNFACSPEAAKWLYGEKALHNNQVSFISNAIDPEEYQFSQETRAAIRTKLGLNSSFVVGHVGRFVAQKNHSFLLRIFKEVTQIRDNSKLLLIGTGPDQKKIAEEADSLGIANDVIFTGAVSDVQAYLQAMDVFIFPSLFEGLPVSLVEAQASGLPILASDSITHDVQISHSLQYMSLSTGPVSWAHAATSMQFNRSEADAFKLLSSSGYNIHKEAKKLEKFYLSQVTGEVK